MSSLLTVSLRSQAIYIPESLMYGEKGPLSSTTSVFVANLARLGFGVTEELLYALNRTTPAFQVQILEYVRTVMGINKNWTPLVKGWDNPTGESVTDHIVTFFANIFQAEGTRLECGHIIPSGTFPLERYNGCPYCGTPFEFGEIEAQGQGSKQRVLELWQDERMTVFFRDLLLSKTALDATQADSLKILLEHSPLPDVEIAMRETQILVIDILLALDKIEEVQGCFKSPTDILRYLWYKKTGYLQIIEPKTIINRTKSNAKAVYFPINNEKIAAEMKEAQLSVKEQLKLKYKRKECYRAALWLNNLQMTPEQMCEIMHPKRGMWVRFIRALRLPEYAKKEGFDRLKTVLDLFFNKKYPVWQGKLNTFRLKQDAGSTLQLLKERPGLFARSLFSNMLWFGYEKVISAFEEIIDKVPARLLFTLSMYSENYFSPQGSRNVKPLGGINKNIPNHKLLKLYSEEQLQQMTGAVEDLCILAVKNRFSKETCSASTIYIDPMLFYIPLAIGDRSDNVQDMPSALTGTRFKTEGNTIRLFMQWGEGLPAGPLDMDLSCSISYNNKSEFCSYGRLKATGCKHSGDIRIIPDKVGTAEYIDINIDELKRKKAEYVTFTCNAYSSGSLSPNLVVGWMDSKYPMTISQETGVAYDPSCVQHQVRITQGLTKGLVFGVLEVETAEIMWLEMAFAGQVVQNLDARGVRTLMKKLDSKLSVGNLLRIKAEAQGLTESETPEADEVYDVDWARNTAAVTRLLLD